MKAKVFSSLLQAHSRVARELILGAPSPVIEPATKISGAPWWPRGIHRPMCSDGHAMAFLAQIAMADVAEAEDTAGTLASFHYCQECSGAGQMAYGWDDAEPAHRRYDIRFFSHAAVYVPDGLGITVGPVLPSHSVRLRSVPEVPHAVDIGIAYGDSPEDYPSLKDDLDENLYNGLLHVHRSKIGGWPSWVQEPTWPPGGRTRWQFLAQFDWVLGKDASWGGGGYAYLFYRRVGDSFEGELCVQCA